MPTPLPNPTSSSSDYVEYTYDLNGNVTQERLRDGQTIGFTYDNLNRKIAEDRSGAGIDKDLTYTYDLQGRLLTSSDTAGHQANFAYDALGRITHETGTHGGTTQSKYNLDGTRRRLIWSDGFIVDYDRLVTGEVSAIRENLATSGIGVLGTYAYDDLGRRTSLTRGNGTVTSYGYDAMSRLSSLSHDLAGTAHDVTTTFTYNPASQIATSTRDNDDYGWTAHYSVDREYQVNGLNQLTNSGNAALEYDARGNLATSVGTTTANYTYSQRNMLHTAPDVSLTYDPRGRLDRMVAGAVGTQFGYDGDRVIAEYSHPSGTMTRRYIRGPGADEPLLWYEGSSERRWLHADERGSVVAVSNATGNAIAINTYDEYGIPGAGNIGAFQYTGQMWLPDLGLYHYKARIYSPTLGRFMQTDPIGYKDGMNWYDYVGGDPVNARDPSGLVMTSGSSATSCGVSDSWNNCDVIVNGGQAGGGGGISAGALWGYQTLRWGWVEQMATGAIAAIAVFPAEEPQDDDKVSIGKSEDIQKFVDCSTEGCTLEEWAAISSVTPRGPIPPDKLRTSTGDTSEEIRRLKAAQEAQRMQDRYKKTKGRLSLLADILEAFFGW